MIKRADLTSNGTHSVLVTGISELVRGREARFLTELDQIKPLHPGDTELVADSSSQFADRRLYLENRLRQSPPSVNVKHTARARSEGVAHGVWIVWIGWWLLFSGGVVSDSLSQRMLPAIPFVAYLGLTLTLIGWR